MYLIIMGKEVYCMYRRRMCLHLLIKILKLTWNSIQLKLTIKQDYIKLWAFSWNKKKIRWDRKPSLENV